MGYNRPRPYIPRLYRRERAASGSNKSFQLLLWQVYKVLERLRSGGSTVKRRREGTPVGNRTSLTPDHAFLVEKIIDDFDAITHLRLCALGHGNDRSADLPRFDIIKRRDAFRPALFEFLFVT